MKMFTVIACLVLMRTQANAVEEFLGTRVGYLTSFSGDELRFVTEWNTAKYAPAACVPIQVNALIRHGSRFPSTSEISSMIELVNRTLEQLSNLTANPPHWFDTIDVLGSGQVPFQLENADVLAETGRTEMEDMGVRFLKRWSAILESATDEEVNFATSYYNRNQESAKYFRKGLSGVNIDVANQYQIAEENELIRFHTYCPLYVSSVLENATARQDYVTFSQGPEMQQVAAQISQERSMQLSPDDVALLWKMAGYAQAAYGQSVWTKLFTTAQRNVIQYAEDLQNYLKTGYAYPIGSEMSCILLSHFFQQMQDAVDASEDGLSTWNKGNFLIGHTPTVQALQTLLGLYKDDPPLKASNYNIHKDRQFRGDKTGPEATNVEFVLYKCDTSSSAPIGQPVPSGVEWPRTLKPYMVQLFVREIPVKFPACSTHLCDYDTVVSEYDEYINDCDFEDRCSEVTSGGRARESSSFMSLFIVLMIVAYFT